MRYATINREQSPRTPEFVSQLPRLPEVPSADRRQLRKFVLEKQADAGYVLRNPSYRDVTQLLIRISDALNEKETADVKLYCIYLLPRGRIEKFNRAVEIFIMLKHVGKIDLENVDFLEELLERMGRQDLIRNILRPFLPPDREIPENPELQPESPDPENAEPQSGTSQDGTNAEEPATSNIYTVVHGHSRMTQETVDLHRRNIASACNTRRSQVKFRGYKKHKSILAHYTVQRENTAVLRLMADHSDPRLVFMGMESLQIDAGVPVKLQQEALLYDVKRQLPVDDIEVGCSTRKKQQRAPRSWTRLWALNLFSDALPLHLQVAASLEYQGFSYSLVRALAERDRLREHQMRRAVHNLRKVEVESNALRQKAEVDSNTLMTLRSKLNIAENRLKEALETNAVLEEKLQQAQKYAEKAARQVATHVTEYRGEKPPGGWSQEYRGEKPPGGWSQEYRGEKPPGGWSQEYRGEKPPEGWPAQVEKADVGTQTPLADTEGTAGQGSDNESKDTEATEQERPQAEVEGAAPRVTGDVAQVTVTFGGRGSEPGKFSEPRGVVVSPSNEIFVADTENKRVQVHSIKGIYLRHFPTVVPGTGDTDMVPHDVSIDSNGTLWVVGSRETAGHVVQYSTDGTAMAGFQLRESKRYRGIVVDNRTNHILVTNANPGEVEVFRPDGSLVRRFGHPQGEMKYPGYITVDGEGNILVTDWNSHYVYVFDESGKFMFKFGGRGRGEGHLWYTYGICTDRAGNIIVADWWNKRVQIFTRHGEYLRSIYTPTGFEAQGLAVGPEGQLVITSYWNHTVTVCPYY
ncbi:uncharacterized protein LOC144908067 [Branchiostoma floridae x Branchiostoma belcheri]